MESENENFYKIAKEIVSVFGKIFATKPYIAVLDALGNVKHIDKPLSDAHLDFLRDFVRKNIGMLNVGDYSFPLGGINLGFFKVSEKAVIVLFTTRGFTGQLLAFKARMHDWAQKIDEAIGDITIPSQQVPITTPTRTKVSEPSEPSSAKPSIVAKKHFRDIPVLVKKLSGKEKFSLNVAQILNLCDGNHSVEDICMELSYNIIQVKDILGTYKKKKWIKMKRVLG